VGRLPLWGCVLLLLIRGMASYLGTGSHVVTTTRGAGGDCCAARERRGKEVMDMSHKRPVRFACLLAVCVLALFPADAFALGNNVGQNVADLLKGYAGDLYGWIVAVVSLVFLLNRCYTELAVLFVRRDRGGVDGVAPSEIATAAEGIRKQIFG
jgi:hypothetical protein